MSWSETLFLKKIIDGKRTLAASDSIIKILPVSSVNSYRTQSFALKKDGSVRLIVKAKSVGTYGGTVDIYKNDTVVATLNISKDTLTSDALDLPISKNDVIFAQEKQTVSISNLTICASVVDDSMIKVIEE